MREIMSSDGNTENLENNLKNQRKKILIVDDRYENRYYLETLLKGNGYDVLTAKNGQEAFEIVKSDIPDAIITDILMPVVDGYSLCQMVKNDRNLAHIPFIFNTASYTESRHRQYALSIGADEYISKPIEPEAFLSIIRSVLDRNASEPKD